MLRPKMRPSLSRKVKYWTIAPSAHKKLGREARRGEHDLRRLVGHANFLDELVEEFHIDDAKEDPRRVAPVTKQKEPAKPKQQEVADSDGEDTASDEEWSECDDSDDGGHALVRTQSGRLQRVEPEEEDDMSSDDEEIYGMVPPLIKDEGSSVETSPASTIEGDLDYFSHGALLPESAGKELGKAAAVAQIDVASPMSIGA